MVRGSAPFPTTHKRESQQSRRLLKTAPKPQGTCSLVQMAQSQWSDSISSARKSLPCNRFPSWACTPRSDSHAKSRRRWPPSSTARSTCSRIIRWHVVAFFRVRRCLMFPFFLPNGLQMDDYAHEIPKSTSYRTKSARKSGPGRRQ